MENKYKEGDEVYAKDNPHTKLKVRRYVNRIYYCQTMLDLNLKDLVYFENELMLPNESNVQDDNHV